MNAHPMGCSKLQLAMPIEHPTINFLLITIFSKAVLSCGTHYEAPSHPINHPNCSARFPQVWTHCSYELVGYRSDWISECILVDQSAFFEINLNGKWTESPIGNTRQICIRQSLRSTLGREYQSEYRSDVYCAHVASSLTNPSITASDLPAPLSLAQGTSPPPCHPPPGDRNSAPDTSSGG